MGGLRFFEKVKKKEIQEIEKKLIHIHKSVISNFICSDILHKEEIIALWKKCNLYVTDVKVNITHFFDNYPNFAICNDQNLLIGEYFIYLIIYLKNIKIKKNPFRIINFYIFANNKWKDKLILQFLKNIFLNNEQYYGNCKTLIIEYLINNYDTFNEFIVSLFYTNVLRYINNKLQINFLKKNQNYLNIFANFLITFNGNATLDLKCDMLKAFFLISKNLKRILLQFPFDKDICTHVCLIYQQIKNIIINYETNIQRDILNQEKNFSFLPNEDVTQKREHYIGENYASFDKKQRKCDLFFKGAPNGNVEGCLNENNNATIFTENTNNVETDEEIKSWNSDNENEGERDRVNQHGNRLNTDILSKYLFFIQKIKELLKKCDDVIREKKRENPFLTLCKYRSVLIIKYKNVRFINVDDTLDYFLLFFKIKNLLNEGSKNPFFIFLCIESLNYWLQKNEKLQYSFERAQEIFAKNEEVEKENLHNELCSSTAEGSRKTSKKKNEGDRMVDHYSSDDILFCGNAEEGGRVDGLNLTSVHTRKKRTIPEREIEDGENILSIKLDQFANPEEHVEINHINESFKHFCYAKKIIFLREIYAVIIKSILLILKKYSWYNIKIIWKSCINVYEHFLTSKKNKFIKYDVYENLTYIIFNQEKKKKYLCLSLLLKYFKNSMCEKNVLEYLFYCFFQNDDFFMFSLYELIKQCVKHIFIHSEDKYLLYYIFVKNILITDSFCMKTFYIKKMIELFYKYDSNYLLFVLNKEYFVLKKYFNDYNEESIMKIGRQTNYQKRCGNNVDNFICLNKANDLKKAINTEYFQFLEGKFLGKNKLKQIVYNHTIHKREENIFLNYKMVYAKKEEEEKKYKRTFGINIPRTYFLYNFHSIENIIYVELYTLCTLRKHEPIEIVYYRNNFYYELSGEILLNVKTLNNFFYFSNDEIILSILSFICENKYLNLCDLYLFISFLNTSITSISRTSRDSYKKYILLFFEKFFIFYQRMVELDKKEKNRKWASTPNGEENTESEDMRNSEKGEGICQNGEEQNGEGAIHPSTDFCNNLPDFMTTLYFLYGNSNIPRRDASNECTGCSENSKNVYASCIFYPYKCKCVDMGKGIFLYNYYLMNILFILFKSTNKDMGIEASVYCSDILNTVVDYCNNFENINFFFFLFNVKTTWKEFYLISKEIFFKTVSIILLKKENFTCLNNTFFPLFKSHKQVDHSFAAFLLKLCFISLNQGNNGKLGNTHRIWLRGNNAMLNVNQHFLSFDFFDCSIKCTDVKNVKDKNEHLVNYISYLFGDNYKNDMTTNVPLYILENFIYKMKKECMMKLTKHKDIENSEMYKLAYYINEFVLYLKENTIFSKQIENEEFYRYFCQISLCNITTFLNFDKHKLHPILYSDISSTCTAYSYLLLLKIYVCNVLYYFINYLNFLFLNNSNSFFFDCRGHLIFQEENEREITSIIIWLSIKYICTLITSIMDFSFKFIITYNIKGKSNEQSVGSQSVLINSIPEDKHEKIDKSAENINATHDKNYAPISFFNNEEIHYIIQNMLCLLLYSKHIACQQYLSDCILNICKIIVIRSTEDMQAIPLLYIYIILLIFKNEKSSAKGTKKKEQTSYPTEGKVELHTNSTNMEIGSSHAIRGGHCSEKPIVYEENHNDNCSRYLHRIINKLNRVLTSKEEENVDISEYLSMNFLNTHFITEKNDERKCANYKKDRKKEKMKLVSEMSCINGFEEPSKFEMKEKLNMLILDNKRININFLRKSSNMCLALSSLAKSYKIKEQYVIYNFIIKIIINYLYNGNNKYKKVICLNIIKHIYTIIDNKTLYEYINDIYQISLIYYKSKFFCLKSSSTSLYNILTKRLLAKLNYSYHVSSNMYYFCTGSKSRLFKNINLTFFDLLNSASLLKIFLSVFVKKCKLLGASFFSNKERVKRGRILHREYKPYFDYSNFYAKFIPILTFLSNIIIFNNDDYFLLCNLKGDLATACRIHKISQMEEYHKEVSNDGEMGIKSDDNHKEMVDSSEHYEEITPIDSTNDNTSSLNIYFLFIKYFKKLLTQDNYFVQVLICRIVVNVYLHIYLKLKKEKLIFYFLHKVVLNAIRKKRKNFYLLLFIEFVKRKESKMLIDENSKKFRIMFFQFLFIFINSRTYLEMLLILQILNILFNRIFISVNKNIVPLLLNKLTLYRNDMFIPVLINELLMKITKTVTNFVSILELYIASKNDYYIESFLYNWFLHIKKREKKEFQIKEHELNKLSSYKSFRFFSKYYEKKEGSHACITKRAYVDAKESPSGEDNDEVEGVVEESVYIYLYLLLFHIISTYEGNIKIMKYCFRILLSIIKFINIENLFLFEKMYAYYMQNVEKNYLDKYIISYSYLVCVKYCTTEGKKEDTKIRATYTPRNNFVKSISAYIDEEKNRIISSLNCNLNDYIFNYAYFYFLLFMNFFSLLYNKNSVTYTKYFVNAFLNYGIIEYNYELLERAEEKINKRNNSEENVFNKGGIILRKKVFFCNCCNVNSASPTISAMENGRKSKNTIESRSGNRSESGSENRSESGSESRGVIRRENLHGRDLVNNNCFVQGKSQLSKHNYIFKSEDPQNGNISVDLYTEHTLAAGEKYEKWYKTHLNSCIREIVRGKIIRQNITCDVVYTHNRLKHVRKYNLFTSFFTVLYSCLIFMLNDENKLLRYKTKIAVLYFMNKNSLHISRNMNDITCTEFFIYYISTYYKKIALQIFTFCIYQTKSCIKNSSYYNPVKLFDQEKYNLYINNILLNHLFMFYYLYTVILVSSQGGDFSVKNQEGGGVKKTNRVQYGLDEEHNINKLGDNFRENTNNHNMYSMRNVTQRTHSEATYFVKYDQRKKDPIDFYIFVDSLGGQKKEKFMNSAGAYHESANEYSSARANEHSYIRYIADVTNGKTNAYEYDLCLLNYYRMWKETIKRNLNRKRDHCNAFYSVSSTEQQIVLIFLSSLRMHHIRYIKRSLDDYLRLLISDTKVDLFDSNFVICLSNLFNKILILLTNLYIFFQKNATIYYNSYFYEEVKNIKNKITSIYNIIKLTRHEINPFLLKSVEFLLHILNNEYLKNSNFFPDIYTLLYSLKFST
ncbi:conserved Plasmodium protein, unknown function [Plasmodium ovale curtisi]|uniref:Uncharacterized protein n=1 Tax=Plasmodium ovale curtisi TaxID=864141 RepID=A0A1A8X2X7_PLAOA|nr:conserved Plasmodium protein, unknown function [Plasmodium ovale curtisi]